MTSADALAKAPAGFVSTPYKGKDFAGQQYIVQVAPDDCTGCGLCVEFCPAKDKSNPRHKAIDMVEAEPRKPAERAYYQYYLSLPPVDRKKVMLDVKGSQFLEPLFEYSGACGGCGETQYVKLLSQLFGDRAVIANATGCSSIYGGNLPTTPWRANAQGRGPAWSNSLFEDNAEFGLGIRLAIDALKGRAERLLQSVAGQVGDDIVGAILNATQHDEAGLEEQRARVVALRTKLGSVTSPDAATLSGLADYLVRKSVWILGGDGWAYDIGYGGLDHVLATGLDVNILVLDTAVYSNTRRAAIQGDSDGRVGEVRFERQRSPGEGPGASRHDLRQCVCRSPRGRRQGQANGRRIPRGRELARAVSPHRVQPLHRPRLRPREGSGAAASRGRLWALAPLPLRPAPNGQGRSAASARFRAGEGQGHRLHAKRRTASGLWSSRTRSDSRDSCSPLKTRLNKGCPTISSSRESNPPVLETQNDLARHEVPRA